MRSYFILLVFSLLISSCTQDQKDEKQTSSVNVADIKFPQTGIALVGKAREIATDWEKYTEFKVAMEGYDHSVDATQRLSTIVVDLKENLIPIFDNNRVTSRLLVLETRIKRYASFLTYSEKSEADYKKHYTAIITAVDEFNGQLNETAYYYEIEKELIEELKKDLENLDTIETDSIP